MRWNAPLSEAHAATLIQRLNGGAAASVLDLGCGCAELLIRVIESAGAGCAGTGVDTDQAQLERAAASITRRGLEKRITLVNAEAQAWLEPPSGLSASDPHTSGEGRPRRCAH